MWTARAGRLRRAGAAPPLRRAATAAPNEGHHAGRIPCSIAARASQASDRALRAGLPEGAEGRGRPWVGGWCWRFWSAVYGGAFGSTRSCVTPTRRRPRGKGGRGPVGHPGQGAGFRRVRRPAPHLSLRRGGGGASRSPRGRPGPARGSPRRRRGGRRAGGPSAGRPRRTRPGRPRQGTPASDTGTTTSIQR